MSSLSNYNAVLFSLAAMNLHIYTYILTTNQLGLDLMNEEDAKLYQLLNKAINTTKKDWEEINELTTKLFKNVPGVRTR